MSDKCKWVEGKFYPCDNFDPQSYEKDVGGYLVDVCYCYGCEEEISRPPVKKDDGIIALEDLHELFEKMSPEEYNELFEKWKKGELK